MCMLLSQSGAESEKDEERMCKKINKRTECLMMIINITIIILLLVFVCCAVSVIGHWPADTAR
jgi:hypothetical protein